MQEVPPSGNSSGSSLRKARSAFAPDAGAAQSQRSRASWLARLGRLTGGPSGDELFNRVSQTRVVSHDESTVFHQKRTNSAERLLDRIHDA